MSIGILGDLTEGTRCAKIPPYEATRHRLPTPNRTVGIVVCEAVDHPRNAKLPCRSDNDVLWKRSTSILCRLICVFRFPQTSTISFQKIRLDKHGWQPRPPYYTLPLSLGYSEIRFSSNRTDGLSANNLISFTGSLLAAAVHGQVKALQVRCS